MTTPVSLLKKLVMISFFWSIFCFHVQAQEKIEDYDFFDITITFGRLGQKVFPAFYRDPGTLFLPVDELFSSLKIYSEVKAGGKVLEGYSGTADNPFRIDMDAGTIAWQGKEFPLSKQECILDMGTLFVRKEALERAFGFKIDFNFRGLSARFSAEFELPLEKEKRLERARGNIGKGEEESRPDTIIPRNYHLLNGTMSEWYVSSGQKGGTFTETLGGLGLGTEILGGETNLWLNWSSGYGMKRNQQDYYWRWVDNHHKIFRQARLGRINVSSVATLTSPVDGISLTNAGTTVRKARGNYQVDGYTDAGWLVEIYINDILSGYAHADASGYYSFKVPVVYGTTGMTLRFYGPQGQERSEERTFTMPYTILPAGEFEYKISGGFVLDSLDSKYGRAAGSYGLSQWLTLSSGVEYYSSVTHPCIPFVQVYMQPLSRLILTGEYDAGVKAEGSLNYTTTGNISLELDYTRYRENQTAIIYNYREKRQGKLTVPFKLKDMSVSARTTFSQNVYSSMKYNSAELVLSGYRGKLNATLGNYMNWSTSGTTNLYSNVAVGMRLKDLGTLRPYAQYNFSTGKWISYKVTFEKNLFVSGYLGLGYENSILGGYRSFNMSFRYNVDWMSSYISSYFSNNKIQTSESVRGGLSFDRKGLVNADRRSFIGTSGITLIPFVDANFDGKQEPDEPVVPYLSARCSGGRVSYSGKDSLLRINGLEPFVDYLVTLDESGFENIAWRLSVKSIRVCTDPNQYKEIRLPVLPMGEVSGVVADQSGNGLGRVLLRILDGQGNQKARIMTESDGYFSYLGLAPGSYTVQPDTDQMKSIGMEPLHAVSFRIRKDLMGDIADIGTLELVTTEQEHNRQKARLSLVPVSQEKLSEEKAVPGKDSLANGRLIAISTRDFIPGDTGEEQLKIIQACENGPGIRKYEMFEGAMIESINGQYFSVQLDAFKSRENAVKLVSGIKPLLTKGTVYIIMQGPYYKVKIGCLGSREEARSVVKTVKSGTEK